jgi:Ca-activated chloride channel family protein
MRARYGEYDGRPFRMPADLDPGDLLDFILAYGDEALDALRRMERDPEHSEMLQQLLDQGLLEKFRGRFRLTPRAVHAMQRRALMEVFSHLRRGRREGHAGADPGSRGERVEGTVPWEFGDPVSEIDLSATLRNALRRMASQGPAGGAGGRPGLPLRVRRSDFERFDSESQANCSTVVLLDQSGSMARFGRFVQAKKCAMALMALIRQRFPSDTVDLIGFHSGADAIRDEKLPLLMPKRVTMYDPVIRLRVPLAHIDRAPQHFTNLHLGLMKARRLLARRGGDNKLVFIITDGQPTAHMQGEHVLLLYPPQHVSHVATLKEALLAAREGMRIATFALTDDYWDMDWLGFVDDLGRLTRGVTFHCTSGDLSACVMESYLSGRKRKAYLA